MRFQIAFVLFSLLPQCQAVASLCPSAAASLCKGCCAKNFHYSDPCRKISDETECGKQIVCNWSDGPVSGAVYSSFDDFLNIDTDFYNCYESESVSSLTAYMATLKDNGAQYHRKKPPLSGACADCYKGNYGPIGWRKSHNVAPGVIAYTDSDSADMDLKKASEVVEEALDTCSLYGIAGDACEQSDIDCKYTKYAKLAEKSLLDGTCASKGYTVKGSTTTKSYPFVGKIVITKYTKASEVVEEALATCSLYGIAGDACEQSDIDCAYTKYAKLAEKSLKDGTCASKGYTVKGSTTTKSYPIVGNIVITKYTKASEVVEEALDTCSLYGIAGDACEQSDIDCKYTKYAKLAEKSLKDGTCASKGYTVKGSTTTKSYPFVGKIVITKYTTPSATILV